MQGTWENGQFVLAATKDSQIERLRADNARLLYDAGELATNLAEASATIERLREALESIAGGEIYPVQVALDALMAEVGEGK